MPWFFVLVCGLYLFFSLLYAWLMARQANSLQKGALCLVICLALPGAGPLLLWFCDCRARSARPEDYSEFYRGGEFCPEDLAHLQPHDIPAETDRVPMEEALEISDRSYRRRTVMQLLDVEDPLVYLPALRRALSNEDGETSHYASVAIMELRRKVQQQLDEAESRWRRAPREAEACTAWEALLYKVLQTDLFDLDVRRRLQNRYIALSDRMLRAKLPTEACLHHRIQLELAQGHTLPAQRLCTRYLTLYPHSEQAVQDQMTVCVQAKNGAGLQRFLRGLRDRPVLLTASTLAWVRAFRKEEPREQRS